MKINNKLFEQNMNRKKSSWQNRLKKNISKKRWNITGNSSRKVWVNNHKLNYTNLIKQSERERSRDTNLLSFLYWENIAAGNTTVYYITLDQVTLNQVTKYQVILHQITLDQVTLVQETPYQVTLDQVTQYQVKLNHAILNYVAID